MSNFNLIQPNIEVTIYLKFPILKWFMTRIMFSFNLRILMTLSSVNWSFGLDISWAHKLLFVFDYAFNKLSHTLFTFDFICFQALRALCIRLFSKHFHAERHHRYYTNSSKFILGKIKTKIIKTIFRTVIS